MTTLRLTPCNSLPYNQALSNIAVPRTCCSEVLLPFQHPDRLTFEEFFEDSDLLSGPVRFFHVVQEDGFLAFCDPVRDQPSGLLYAGLEETKERFRAMIEGSIDRTPFEDVGWDTSLGALTLRQLVLEQMRDDLFVYRRYLAKDVWEWEINQNGEITAYGGPVFGYQEAVEQVTHALLNVQE